MKQELLQLFAKMRHQGQIEDWLRRAQQLCKSVAYEHFPHDGEIQEALKLI